METLNPLTLSELPHDLLRNIFKRLSFADFHRAKIVCSTWNSISKQTAPPKTKSLWLTLFPQGEDSCVLYNPDEDMIYKSERDFSGIRFLANHENWFLVIDSKSNLFIIDVFSENRIDFPPLESLMPDNFTFERLGDNKFKWQVTNYLPEQDLIISYQTSEDLSGLLWVDKKTIATLLPIARKVMIITVTLNYDSFSTIRFKEYPILYSMVSFFTSL